MVVESNRIEFKRKLNERLEKEVVAVISDNYLRIIFPFEKGQYFSVKQNTTQETENTTQETQNTTQEMENTTQEILKLIEKKPNITRNELAKNIGITPDGIKYHLMKLKNKGIIIRVGSTKKGYWKIFKA